MSRNDLLMCLLVGISVYFIAGTDARVAIVGGHVGTIHDFGYQVTLEYNGHEACGGGIIDETHILTAAHCVLKPNGDFRMEPLTVVAGANDIKKTSDTHMVKILVQKAFVLKELKNNFEILNATGDIAVLKLQHSLDFKKHKHLKHLELPGKHENIHDKTGKIAGFGYDTMKAHIVYRPHPDIERIGSNNDSLLHFMEAKVINDKECDEKYPYKNINSQKQFCARAIVKDSGVCDGDSGGPLVLNKKTVIGILSEGSPTCIELVRPGLYTRVSHYLHFIEHARHGKHHDDILTLHYNL